MLEGKQQGKQGVPSLQAGQRLAKVCLQGIGLWDRALLLEPLRPSG